MRKGCGSAGFSKGDTVGSAVVLSGLSEIIIELSEKRALPGTFLPQMLQSGPGSRYEQKPFSETKETVAPPSTGGMLPATVML
jgi:hypothetical protein